MKNKFKEHEMNNEGFDICYTCGAVQEYGTMKEINEVDFDILCDKCSKNNNSEDDENRYNLIKQRVDREDYKIGWNKKEDK